MTDNDTSQHRIDWVKTAAGALAAVSSAVLLSTLGAAGTLIGAAVGSVAVTVSQALYQQGLARSRATVLKAQEVALSRVGAAPAEVRRTQRPPGRTSTRAALDETPPRPSGRWRDGLAALPWSRVAALAVGTFVAVVAVLSVFEVVSGQTVSNLTGGSDSSGGTTITRVTGDDGNGGRDGGGGRDEPRDDEGTTPSPSPSASDEPTQDATESPTSDPTSPTEPTPTPAEPSTDAPTDVPSDTPAPDPTPSAAPSATPGG